MATPGGRGGGVAGRVGIFANQVPAGKPAPEKGDKDIAANGSLFGPRIGGPKPAATLADPGKDNKETPNPSTPEGGGPKPSPFGPRVKSGSHLGVGTAKEGLKPTEPKADEKPTTANTEKSNGEKSSTAAGPKPEGLGPKPSPFGPKKVFGAPKNENNNSTPAEGGKPPPEAAPTTKADDKPTTTLAPATANTKPAPAGGPAGGLAARSGAFGKGPQREPPSAPISPKRAPGVGPIKPAPAESSDNTPAKEEQKSDTSNGKEATTDTTKTSEGAATSDNKNVADSTSADKPAAAEPPKSGPGPSRLGVGRGGFMAKQAAGARGGTFGGPTGSSPFGPKVGPKSGPGPAKDNNAEPDKKKGGAGEGAENKEKEGSEDAKKGGEDVPPPGEKKDVLKMSGVGRANEKRRGSTLGASIKGGVLEHMESSAPMVKEVEENRTIRAIETALAGGPAAITITEAADEEGTEEAEGVPVKDMLLRKRSATAGNLARIALSDQTSVRLQHVTSFPPRIRAQQLTSFSLGNQVETDDSTAKKSPCTVPERETPAETKFPCVRLTSF